LYSLNTEALSLTQIFNLEFLELKYVAQFCRGTIEAYPQISIRTKIIQKTKGKIQLFTPTDLPKWIGCYPIDLDVMWVIFDHKLYNSYSSIWISDN